jgi:hypothetical protein
METPTPNPDDSDGERKKTTPDSAVTERIQSLARSFIARKKFRLKMSQKVFFPFVFFLLPQKVFSGYLERSKMGHSFSCRLGICWTKMRSNSIYSVVIGLNQEALSRPLVTPGIITLQWRKTNPIELLLC